jgi:hypothetical protein
MSVISRFPLRQSSNMHKVIHEGMRTLVASVLDNEQKNKPVSPTSLH